MQQGADAADNQLSSRGFGVLAAIAMIAGLALRVVEFTRNRPLWLDEAMLGLNIASRSIGQLALPLDYDQSAPLLYLWLERLAVSMAGVSERSLRVVPFVAGLVLVPLVLIVARRLSGTTTAAIAGLLAALSLALVTFSAEAKQYGVDPVATLLPVWLASRVQAKPHDARAWTWLVIGGVVSLQLSQPAAFVLAGLFVALACDRGVRAAVTARASLAVAGGVWALMFLWLYVRLYRATAQSPYMRQFWEGTFLDARAADFGLRLRLFDVAVFQAPTLAGVPLGWAGVLAIAWAAGVWTLWRRRPFSALVVAMPLVFATAANALGAYPVMDRLWLFAAPLTLVAFASLVAWAVELVPPRSRLLALAGAAAAIVVLVSPTHVRRIRNPVFYAVGRQVVADVDSMARGEAIYIAARSFPLWIYYTTDWSRPDTERLRWAASIAGAGGAAHNNAPSRGRVRAADTTSLARRYRGRTEIVGLPTGRQYLTSTRSLDPGVGPAALALPAQVDTGWAELEVRRMASAARPRLWVFGSHMFAIDGAEPALVAALQERGVHLVMERRQGSTVAYQVEFPGQP